MLAAYAVRHKDYPLDWPAEIVNARSAAHAKYRHHKDLVAAGVTCQYPDLRVRFHGELHSSAAFIGCAAGRGLPHLRCGHRVLVGGQLGTVIGHTPSANFEIILDPAPGRPERIHIYHPDDLTIITPKS